MASCSSSGESTSDEELAGYLPVLALPTTPSDVLSLDSLIKITYSPAPENVNKYRKRLTTVSEKLKKGRNNLHFRDQNRLSEERRMLEEFIKDVEERRSLSQYIELSHSYISDYKNFLKTPIKYQFYSGGRGRPTTSSVSAKSKKWKLTDSYLQIASKYLPLSSFNDEASLSTGESSVPVGSSTTGSCGNCGHSVSDKIDSYFEVCTDCGLGRFDIPCDLYYKDSDRINIGTKYKYESKSHFRDTIDCFEGKQKKKPQLKVYQALEREFIDHNLAAPPPPSVTAFGSGCPGTEESKQSFHSRHSKITKGHIKMFLRETGYTKHYEDINYIHYYFTGINPPCVLDRERLEKEFEILKRTIKEKLSEYDNRTNALHNQDILYRFLKRYGENPNENDFQLLRTIDRKLEYDEILEKAADIIGWKHIPLI